MQVHIGFIAFHIDVKTAHHLMQYIKDVHKYAEVMNFKGLVTCTNQIRKEEAQLWRTAGEPR